MFGKVNASFFAVREKEITSHVEAIKGHSITIKLELEQETELELELSE